MSFVFVATCLFWKQNILEKSDSSVNFVFENLTIIGFVSKRFSSKIQHSRTSDFPKNFISEKVLSIFRFLYLYLIGNS